MVKSVTALDMRGEGTGLENPGSFCSNEPSPIQCVNCRQETGFSFLICILATCPDRPHHLPL